EAYPLPANRNMVHRGKGQAALKGPPAAFGAAPTPVVTPHLPRRRSFPWTGVAIGIVLLLTLGLTLLLFKASMVPLVSSPTVAFATVPSPSAVAFSPTTVPLASSTTDAAAVPNPPASPFDFAQDRLRASPSAAAPSPTAALPSPTVAPTMHATQTIKLRVWEADGAEMVFVPAGEFVMGSENLGDDERPAHRVYLDDFWIDRYEVTNERFALFVTATGYQTEAERRGWGWVWKGSDGSTELTTGWEKVEGADWRHPRGPDPSTTLRQGSGQRSSIADKMDHPVVLVSWNDADTYCRW
ncbi:MAG: SUMF1/EgtB/PvdO family nonheme iron enzyme, partial [Anaerolineae bacterium]|nr:SUMF1/EgtB/PvdO family nonheme iron enzyme [Anaerolineae bacterium]